MKKVTSGVSRLLGGTSLKAECARGVMALGIGTVSGRGMKFVRNMILARILAPDEFGVMAIILIVARLFEAFTQFGVKQSIIQNKRGADHEYLNVAWWFGAIRGFCIFAIAMLAAPWISSFYDKPDLLSLLRVSFLATVLRGLASPRIHVLEKEFRFGRSVFLIQGSAILATILTIGLAFVIQNVWALVIGFVSEMAIFCVLSYVFVPFLPRFRVDRECLRELMKFACGMFGLPVLAFISIHTPVLVLAKLVTDEQLGMYSLALILTVLPIDSFSRIINPVLLSALAKKQDKNDSLRQVVLRITRGTAIVGAPLVAFMACCASGILLLAYGSKYIAVAIPCGILCLQILVQTEGGILATVFLAMGKPHLHRRVVAVRAVITVGLIYPAIVHFGLSGAAGLVVLGNFTALLVRILQSRKVIDIKISSYIRCYVPGLVLALPVMGIVAVLRLSGVNSPIWLLIGGALALAVAFIGGLFVLNRRKSSGIKRVSEDRPDRLPSVEVDGA